MTNAAESTILDGVALLRRVATDPFVVLDESATRDDGCVAWLSWARHLRESFPLWCFRPSAFAALNGGELPTTHPLGAFVRSIVADEEAGEPPRLLTLHGVDALVLVNDGRRCGLSREGSGGRLDDAVASEPAGYRLIGSYGYRFGHHLDGAVLATFEEDTEYSIGGYVSPYEEIGVRLVQLVEAREAARPGSPERRAAAAALKEFAGYITLQARGRPTDLREDIARAITAEGERLVALVVEALSEPIELSTETHAILASFGVPAADMVEWALRLALPVFSRVELGALRREARTHARRAGGLKGSMRTIVVWLLAHRLRRRVNGIARKATHGWAAELIGASDTACEICGTAHDGRSSQSPQTD